MSEIACQTPLYLYVALEECTKIQTVIFDSNPLGSRSFVMYVPLSYQKSWCLWVLNSANCGIRADASSIYAEYFPGVRDLEISHNQLRDLPMFKHTTAAIYKYLRPIVADDNLIDAIFPNGSTSISRSCEKFPDMRSV